MEWFGRKMIGPGSGIRPTEGRIFHSNRHPGFLSSSLHSQRENGQSPRVTLRLGLNSRTANMQQDTCINSKGVL